MASRMKGFKKPTQEKKMGSRERQRQREAMARMSVGGHRPYQRRWRRFLVLQE
jgi:hypothetical protein